MMQLKVICDDVAVIARYGTFVKDRGPFSTANFGRFCRILESTTETFWISLAMVYTYPGEKVCQKQPPKILHILAPE
jgi:hypothetical protein